MESPKIHKPIFLKNILDLMFWLLIIGLIGSIIILVLKPFLGLPVDFKINEFEVKQFSPIVIVGVFLKSIQGIIFIYIIYLLRKLVQSFFSKKLFTPLQISGLKLIGQLIIFVSIMEVFLNFFITIFLKNRFELSIPINTSFSSLWFTLALGLFFILLSQSFSYAKNLQEENDLTV